MGGLEVFGLIIALVFTLKVTYNLGHYVYTTFLGRLLGHGIDLRKCGPWAVVTGATDGIGKSYAIVLASKGLNVVLVSRTPAKLEKVAEEIKSKYGTIQIKTVAVDFTEGKSIYTKLNDELSQLEIGLLVNNVGMSIGFAETYSVIPEDGVHDVVNCNMMSMTRMTRIVLPQMMERKRGVIINIGSLSGVLSTPLATLYGATKAFVDKFSRNLSAEVQQYGVTVQTVHPGFVVTNMTKIKRASMSAPNPDVFATAALNTLGLENRTAGFWFHKIQLYWGELATFLLPSVVEQQSLKFMEKYRLRMLSRLNKSK